MSWRLALPAVFALTAPACFSHHEAPELLVCPETPYAGERFLRRSESPANGRIWACEACTMHEEEVLARAVALGCRLTGAHDACTLTGACDYPGTVTGLSLVRATRTCEELAVLAATDLCVRPDPAIYWRPEGD